MEMLLPSPLLASSSFILLDVMDALSLNYSIRSLASVFFIFDWKRLSGSLLQFSLDSLFTLIDAK